MAKKVFVGLSGGVDSSVTAALLKEQGYDVTGVYMKNWSKDLPGFPCPWKEDFQDAKRVAVQLGIAFKMYDFETDYRHKVVDYMLREYQAGRTPNPDVMCNQEVKFKLFKETEGRVRSLTVREFETLLRWELRPPLNEEEVPRHMQAWRAAMHCGKTEIAERARALHLGRVTPMLAPAMNAPKVAGG